MRPDGADYWYAAAWQPLHGAHGSTGRRRASRISVRQDTCAQIYEDAHLSGTYPSSYEIGFAPPTRGNWVEWERPIEPATHPVDFCFDLQGGFQPDNASPVAE